MWVDFLMCFLIECIGDGGMEDGGGGWTLSGSGLQCVLLETCCFLFPWLEVGPRSGITLGPGTPTCPQGELRPVPKSGFHLCGLTLTT